MTRGPEAWMDWTLPAQELQRLRQKIQDAESLAESLGEESRGLANDVASLQARASSDTSRAEAAAAKAKKEMDRLRARVEELEGMKALEGSEPLRSGRQPGPTVDAGEEPTGRTNMVRVGAASRGSEVEGDGVEGARGDDKEWVQGLVQERDRLRADLRKSRQEAAERAAALETQLADTEVRLGRGTAPRPAMGHGIFFLLCH